jgi:arylsulfatase A-like enzyme
MRGCALGSVQVLTLAMLLSLAPPAPAQQPNILLMIADDLGVDRVGAYAAVPDPGHTPVIDALAADGVLFRNAWSNPTCPPTRAGILTGRQPRSTGFCATNFWNTPTELPLAESALPELLPPEYRSAAVGKWHMGSLKVSGWLHPLLQGFEHFRGSMTIFDASTGDSYSDFTKVIDGTSFVPTTNYATTDQVDDALDLIDGWGAEPWFLWLAFHAPHAPFHKPPASLHTFGSLPNPVGLNIPVHMKAMAEAMDTEIGRLLDSLDPSVRANTIVLFVGDNGTDKLATTAPFLPSHAKGTVYQGGVNVPLIASGPGIARGAECQALVSTTDLHATILELAGAATAANTDSVSLVPYFTDPGLPSLRATVYTEVFLPNGNGPYTSRARALRDGRYKLMQVFGSSAFPTEVHLFDLLLDPFELDDLLASPLDDDQQVAYASLAAGLAEPQQPWLAMSYTGMPGTLGLPTLSGAGSLLAGEAFTLTLAGTVPAAFAGLVVGTQNLHLGLKGGVLAPDPAIVVSLVTGPAGSLAVSGHWPPGIPPGTPILFQAWIDDPGALFGWSGSNGLAATAP